MSAPEPGWMPITVPSALPRSRAHGYLFSRPHMPLKTLPMRSTAILSGGSRCTMKRRISDTANMPTIIGIRLMPPVNSVLPKVKRGKPAGLSRPTQAISSPTSSEMLALRTLALPMNTAPARPSTTIQKYS
jgi:hypothetical protein